MSRRWRGRAAGWMAVALLACAPLAASAQDLARDPRLLELAGWQDAPLRPWRTRNDFILRSLGTGERESPRQFLDANLARYASDSEYACRRPALARFFDAHAAAPRVAATNCPATLPFVLAAPEAGSPLLALDPARVYAVDYLLAEGNDAPMSRWGHSMLRVVVCAPGRAPGPDCRLDLGEHLVLSFRAFVDDVQVSSWRGLTGSYPSRLFVLPLTQVVAEYTEVELRALRSIPLRLSPGEIATLLQRAAVVHWSYDGRYAFIGNNCAVETARLLQAGVPRLSAMPLMSVTPTGLLRRLRRHGVAEADAPTDRGDAVRLGEYFEPADAHQEVLYAVARDTLGLPWPTAEAWLRLPAARRATFVAAGDLRSAAALLVLEQLALRRIEHRARDLLKRRLPGTGRQAVRDALALEAVLTQPAALLDTPGYGLPQPAELAALKARSGPLAERWHQDRARLLQLGRSWLPPALLAERQAIEANFAALDVRLRALRARENDEESR